MQIVSSADNLYEMSNVVFWENEKKYLIVSFAENFHSAVLRNVRLIASFLSSVSSAYY